MSHKEQRDFCERVKKLYPDRFLRSDVLDVGSLDVNGSNRIFFDSPLRYLGIDMVAGKGVDRVCRAQDVDGEFGVVICTEVLEHDPDWKATVRTLQERTATNGLLVLTCAGPGRPEHGTRRRPKAGMVCTSDYYRNVAPHEVLECLDLRLWRTIHAETRVMACDTQVYGIRA